MTEDFGNQVVAVQPAALPVEVLKNKRVINLYYVAVVALAAVVLLLPVIGIWAVFPDVVWNGWLLCIGGLISLIGAQSTAQPAVQQ